MIELRYAVTLDENREPKKTLQYRQQYDMIARALLPGQQYDTIPESKLIWSSWIDVPTVIFNEIHP